MWTHLSELLLLWVDRLKHAAAFARRVILRVPFILKARTGSKATRPEPPRGHAPRPGTHFEGHEAGPGHPVIDRLRRRAVNELFDWLGLTLIPPQIWPILERADDPGQAVEQLILALGCNPEHARLREAVEIVRLQTAIDLLAALDTVRPHLRREHLQEIEYLLFSGNYDVIERYSRIVASLSGILIGHEKYATLPVFAVYSVFIAEVQRYIANPMSLDPDDADEALRLSDGFITAMENYAVLHAKISEAIGALLAAWPDGLEAGDDIGLRDGMILQFDEIGAALLGDATLGLAKIKSLIDELALLFEDLKDLFDRVCGSPAPDEPAGMSAKDEALVFFGFAAGSSPSLEEINKVWRVFITKVHPDHAGSDADPEERRRREDLTKQANIYHDCLRRAAAA